MNAPVPPDPKRLFTLNLAYPAVLGAMMVLLFIHIAMIGITTSATEPATLFGSTPRRLLYTGYLNAKCLPTIIGRSSPLTA